MPRKTATKTKKQQSSRYQVLLREGGGGMLKVDVEDDILYPLAVTWNRVLATDRERTEKSGDAWNRTGHEAILSLAEQGLIKKRDAEKFIAAAAASGFVQVEFEWVDESHGYAARIFPWEHVIALATKAARMEAGHSRIVVVRVLHGGKPGTVAKGPPAYAACEPPATFPKLDFDGERAAINAALGKKMIELDSRSLDMLRKDIKGKKPAVVHIAAMDTSTGPFLAQTACGTPLPLKEMLVAEATASHFPKLAVYSSCFSGRRLAPCAVASGAEVAIGFHGEVMDESMPLFFGAFYRQWNRNAEPLAAVLAGLDAHNSQCKPSDLGIVTLWSAKSLIETQSAAKVALETRSVSQAEIELKHVKAALAITYKPEESLNYSVLHNSRGGIFVSFSVTKNHEGNMPPLDLLVRLDAGEGRPFECRLRVALPAAAPHKEDLTTMVHLPLGAPLLRQRGEALRATLETTLTCGNEPLFQQSNSILLLPCDEWRDDQTGRHLLPSFIFPRDPAVRKIITAAQPFLRVLSDAPQAGFDGYQAGFSGDANEAVRDQVNAIWAALQHTYGLDYVSPPPVYTKASQRLRTPEEILLAERGTCIELALLLASCMEHVGVYPVLFLTVGHAFVGYWTSEQAHTEFTKDPGYMMKFAARKRSKKDAANAEANDVPAGQGKVSWLFTGQERLAAIVLELANGRLVALEATGLALQRPFSDSIADASELLGSVLREVLSQEPGSDVPSPFDGMLDVQTARLAGVIPVPIISHGPAA